MATKVYDHGIYISGVSPVGRDPNSFMYAKIGQAGNNSNRAARLGECQRQIPGAIEHAWFLTDQGDRLVNEYLCNTYPLQFGGHTGAGRDVIKFLVKDFSFLIAEATRYFNFDTHGRAKFHSFPLRREQQECLAKTHAFYDTDKTNVSKEFLWDCKMRFGKTHVAYKLIMEMDFGLTLILTSRPTDTKQAWLNATDHVDFDFGVDNFIDTSKQGDNPITILPNGRTVIFASLQDFARMIENGFKEKFKNFPTFIFDLVVCDECHIGFDTEKTKTALSKIQYRHLLNLSGTPFRALLEERFSDNAKFTWSYLDEQRVRTKELIDLRQDGAEKYGKYYWLCPMKIFAIQISQEMFNDVNLYSDDEGFTFAKMFHTEMVNNRTVFRNDIAVNSFLNSLSHGTVMPYSDQAGNCHQYDAHNLKHTLWYVPGVPEAKLLKEKLKHHKIFSKYDIIMAADDNGNEGNDTAMLVRSRIAEIESGRNENHIGTITLTCGKLTHGISVPEWGSVFNFSDMKSAQLYFQFIFRGQTPWRGRKHECYVFDFNPNRTLMHLHSLAKATTKTGDIKPVLIEMLNVFNVLCYEDNKFNRIDASNLLIKLESGFGKAASLTGLQTLFKELPFELDNTLCEGLDDIEDNLSSKSPELKVNSNDIKNGKNSNNPSNGVKKKNDTTKTFDERRKIRMQLALSKVPLYFYLTGDVSFDELVNNLELEKNNTICKTITGIPANSLKKILGSQSQERKLIINEGIIRFRSQEEQDYISYQNQINQ